ncbi:MULTISPECIES: hypothetical protein [unclassified Moorena]|nr:MULTISPECIES: hypothetical protein [unclassified Moorena]NEO12535.1 hypothetical protein [Moorena sp. SIO3E8]NEO47852.1 hypothetical protein [Moorena sp. SIO4A3]NEQ01329.1 hypothetical protein [Moorena sp. SIO3F7]
MANLIRQRKAHLSGLGGFPHERLHQDGNREKILCTSGVTHGEFNS